MKLLLGAKGRLGGALSSQFAMPGVQSPDRSVYQDWWRPDAVPEITRYVEEHGKNVDAVFVAAGVIDPAASAADHERVNFLLPQQVILAMAPLGIRVVTFGTVMEAVTNRLPSSGYVASKVALAEFVERQVQKNSLAMHLRIHTLYGGGLPASFMFTGQMLHALRNRTQFRMSPGTQLREYHHIDDEGPAVAALAGSDARGIVELNHGDAVSLAEIAESTFRILGAPELLQVGALPMPENERVGIRFSRTPLLEGHVFRDVRINMADYLSRLLREPKA
ncbi:NAD-dependent epimerase/dehydratase family protein [Variovorax sp. GT1P44]|uniref:NAD-dependent epimerase/dehydratase family protein n=1 Tax=Variovorax sp. GT1P44 TaxID=3443742 RepID=UPI003F4608CC